MKAKDFTESAVNLCNPEPVKALLDKLSIEEAAFQSLKDELQASNAELALKILDQALKVSDLGKAIREAIEEHGSFQDTETERYAVKYARKTAEYGNLPSFKKNFPKFVELCIKEVLDVNALKGQVKGKLITEEQLEKARVLTYETSHAFYVR